MKKERIYWNGAIGALISLIVFYSPAFPEKVTLTLSQCLERALQENPNIIKMHNTSIVASTNVQASISRILPQISASSSFSRNGPESKIIYNPFSTSLGQYTFVRSGYRDNYYTAFSLAEEFINLSSWAQIRRSYFARKSAGADLSNMKVTITENVTEAYYTVLKYTKAVAVAAASVAQSEEQVILARNNLQIGNLTQASLLQAEVALLQNRAQVISAATALSNAEQSLALLIGVSEQITVDTSIAFPDTTQEIVSPDSLISLALNNNYSLISAERRVRSLKAALYNALFRKLPSIGFSSSYAYSDSVQFNSINSWKNNNVWSLGISLNWNIFDGLYAESQIRQARANLSTTLADLLNTRLTVINGVRHALNMLWGARQNLSVVGPLLSQARLDYELTKEKYRVGAASTLDLLANQVSVNQAEQWATDAVCDYYIAWAKLRESIGER